MVIIMAREIESKGLFFAILLLSLHICTCSGTLVGFSYDATHETHTSWSPQKTLTFLQNNKVSSSQFRVLLSNPEAYLDSLSKAQIRIDYFLNSTYSKLICTSKSSAISWVETHLMKLLPHLNISNIIVESSKHQDLTSFLLTLNSIHSALSNYNLDEVIKVSPMISLSSLDKNLPSLARFVKTTNSFIYVETFVNREATLGDGFVHSILERAVSACHVLLPYHNIQIFLSIKSSVAPSGVEIAEFTNRVMKFVDAYPQLENRISGLFIDISHSVENEQKKMNWEKEMIFPTSRRQLLDTVAPFTTPSTTPSPNIVTNPSTNPTTTLPTTSPISVPSTTPVVFPSTNPVPPVTYPVTNPTTAPMNPVTNPVNPPVVMPVTNPVNPPVTNPVTAYPFPPPLSVTPSTGMPGTVPVSPGTGSGQSWCVARSDATEEALQSALDYACGIGGADCSGIQMSGSCYNPNSLQAHASYAFNNYYQKNPVPTSCDFGGAAMTVTINPSSGTCSYPSSSSASGLNPAPSTNTGTNTGTGSTGIGTEPGGIGVGPPGIGTGPPGIGIGPIDTTPTPSYGANSGSGSSVLNTNTSGGSNTVFGSDGPTGTISRSQTLLPTGWILSLVVIVNLFGQ